MSYDLPYRYSYVKLYREPVGPMSVSFASDHETDLRAACGRAVLMLRNTPRIARVEVHSDKAWNPRLIVRMSKDDLHHAGFAGIGGECGPRARCGPPHALNRAVHRYGRTA